MLTSTLIARQFESKQWSNLMQDLSRNGLALPLSLMVRLSSSEAAVVALGLRRLMELSRRTSGLSQDMTWHLHEAQLADGSFENDPLATGAAIAGLAMVLGDQVVPGLATDPTFVEISQMKERAIHALAAMQRGDGLFDFADDRSEQDRMLVAAFLLFLLGRDEEFRSCVRLSDLLDCFESHEDELEPDTARLWSMARANTRPSAGPRPLAASVAA